MTSSRPRFFYGYIIVIISFFIMMVADGTFYSFPSFRTVIERMDGIEDDVQLAQLLLEKAEVALVPGTAFGLPGHIRLSFATDMQSLEKALSRIQEAIR